MKGFSIIFRVTLMEARPEAPASRTEAGQSPAGLRRSTRRHAVFNLVLASFVIASTPMALDLVWRLAAGVGGWIGQRLTAAAADSEPRKSVLSLSPVDSSC